MYDIVINSISVAVFLACKLSLDGLFVLIKTDMHNFVRGIGQVVKAVEVVTNFSAKLLE